MLYLHTAIKVKVYISDALVAEQNNVERNMTAKTSATV